MASSTVVRIGTRPSTNATVSYGPQSPLTMPAGSPPKSIRRPSPVSGIWSWNACRSKAASLSPTPNVTLAGSPS